jgi:hypothetical protein
MQKSCNRIDGVRYAAVGCVDSVSPGRRSHQVPKHVSSGGLTSGTGIPRPDLFSTWRSYGRHSLSLMLRHLASNHQNPDHVSPSLKQQANISTLGPWVSIFLYLLDHVNKSARPFRDYWGVKPCRSGVTSIACRDRRVLRHIT